MDVNKEVDRLDRAVKRNDIDEAVEVDTNLAVREQLIVKTLESMPLEHSQTMGFFFREWIMKTWDDIIFILMIVFSFQIENELGSILLGGAGLLLLVMSLMGRMKFSQFVTKDISRMRDEKMMGNDVKMQLNFIRASRKEHETFIESALREKMKDDPMGMGGLGSMFGNMFGGQETQLPPQETLEESVDETSEDEQDPLK